MNDKITIFLNSDLLDKYLIGQTDYDETKLVESYINKYPQVKDTYNKLQDNLEFVAQTQAIEAPKAVLNSVLEALDTKPVVTLQQQTIKRKSWFSYAIAASFAALIFAGSSYILYDQNQQLKGENQKIVDEIFDLRGDIQNNNQKLSTLMDQFLQLNNPETEKYVIKGNKRAKNLKTVAYINPKERTSLIDVVSLPQLPEEQQYQMWADIEGKMVNLGILKESDRKLKPIPYSEDALGLHITIENKGEANTYKGNSVAEILLKNSKQ
ncbi:anti-sigma factor domain-containing protein [Lacinutrix salivirga]